MTVPRQVLEPIGNEWSIGDPAGDGFARKRWLQGLSDTLSRPINNRVAASTPSVAVVCNGAIQSTGLGSGPIVPSKYAETQVQARVTLSAGTTGVYQVYIFRTTGAIPALGAAPNAGDVIVGGDSFGGGSLAAGVATPATLAAFDQGLNQSVTYRYYFAVKGPNGDTLSLINNSQLTVSEF